MVRLSRVFARLGEFRHCFEEFFFPHRRHAERILRRNHGPVEFVKSREPLLAHGAIQCPVAFVEPRKDIAPPRIEHRAHAILPRCGGKDLERRETVERFLRHLGKGLRRRESDPYARKRALRRRPVS